ncbi:MAG TPA: hypothetical protein VFQ61_08655 [Polyangiaceae bacterium]|nr:hypothetical protein [Polyangiaceae bacterium]
MRYARQGSQRNHRAPAVLMSQARVPIIQRLEHLERQLAFFEADREARMLCWALAPDEQRLMEGCLQKRIEENSEREFLVLLDEPFGSEIGHGLSLVRELKALTDAETEAFAQSETYDIPWSPPPLPRELRPRKGRAPDPLYFRDALLSLHEHLCAMDGLLLVALWPEAISDSEQYAQWLAALVPLLEVPHVRVLLPCERGGLWAQTLARTHAPRVRWIEANLNMPAALEEICAAAEDHTEPSGQYRAGFVRAMNALAAGNYATAREHAETSAALARHEAWPHLEFAAHQLLGSGALGLGQPREAVARFEAAERAVAHDLDHGKNTLTPLLLQARLCKGSAWMVSGNPTQAAQIFEREALPVAHVLGDRAMQLEALRLAAQCLERGGDTGGAWKRAVAAVAVGASIPPQARSETSLAQVGELLLQLLKGFGHGKQRAAIRAKFNDLLGPDWEGKSVPQSATAEDMLQSPLAEKAPPLLDDSDRDPVEQTFDISASIAAEYLGKLVKGRSGASAASVEAQGPSDQTWDASALVSDPADRTWDYPGGIPQPDAPLPGPGVALESAGAVAAARVPAPEPSRGPPSRPPRSRGDS